MRPPGGCEKPASAIWKSTNYFCLSLSATCTSNIGRVLGQVQVSKAGQNTATWSRSFGYDAPNRLNWADEYSGALLAGTAPWTKAAGRTGPL